MPAAMSTHAGYATGAEGRLSIPQPGLVGAPIADFLPRLARVPGLPEGTPERYMVLVDFLDPIDGHKLGSASMSPLEAMALRDGLASVVTEAWYALGCPPTLDPRDRRSALPR